MHTMLQDIRFALRTLRKTPGFTAVAILTLALGIGANTAIFTVVNAVFFHPLAITDPEHIVSLFTTDVRNRGALSNYLPISHPNAEDIARSAQSLSAVAITSGSGVSMTINGQPQQLNSEIVSGNYFDLLGVHAALGRTFRPDEGDREGAGPVLVLSHGTWVRRFSSDPNVVGKAVLLNGSGFAVVDGMPRGCQREHALAGPGRWAPWSMHQQILTGF